MKSFRRKSKSKRPPIVTIEVVSNENGMVIGGNWYAPNSPYGGKIWTNYDGGGI